MGMNHLGEIRYLTRLASPGVALITNAGTAHIGELGSRDAIAQAKGEIYEGVPGTAGGGIALVNADDRYADYWRGLNAQRRVIDFGIEQPAVVRGAIRDGQLDVRTTEASYTVQLRVPGMHNLRNALAACAVAHALEIPAAPVIAGLAEYQGVKGRLQAKPGRNGSLVIDDTYNANPDSTKAAIAVLAQASGRRLLVLGDMGELGVDAAALHAEVGVAARHAGLDGLFTLGELAEAAARAFGAGAKAFRDVDALCSQMQEVLTAGVTVLVKGSRSMRMERVVARLAEGEAAAANAGDH
jgi:UDP-N-acetylmuramoyl-tripeptide--D-alanyl-D-alanine ligase